MCSEKADAEAAKQAAEAAAAAAAAAAKAQPKEVPELKMNLPKIPRMPVGWKPGDPIPLPPEWNTGSLVPGPVPDKPAGVYCTGCVCCIHVSSVSPVKNLPIADKGKMAFWIPFYRKSGNTTRKNGLRS